MSYVDSFSTTYAQARERFRSAAIANSFHLEEFFIDKKDPNGEDIAIDVAAIGDNYEYTVIISSGLHGVEGFFGSALQCAFLEDCFSRAINRYNFFKDVHLILIHSLNPYGFAWLRRSNEDNIDLNRNFLLLNEKYVGSPEKYRSLDSLFNPVSPPSRFEPFFLIKLMASILQHGMADLKEVLAVGQYDFPKGLFFGGHSQSKTYSILAANVPRWIKNATNILHIDLHTGLGRKGIYKIFVDEPRYSVYSQWLIRKFGDDLVVTSDQGGVGYNIRGSLGRWCKAMFTECNYTFLTAEFGTYPILQVFEALRAENRVHFWGKPESFSSHWATQRLVEIFAPEDPKWRELVVSQGLDLIYKAIAVG